MSNHLFSDDVSLVASSPPVTPSPQVRGGKCEAVVANVDGVTLATISGSIDAASVADFDGHLVAACGSGSGRVVVDMSDVDFLSVDGIAALHELARRMVNGGGALAISGGRAVSRPLRRTGLTRLIPVFDWLPKAFDSVGGIAPAH